MVFKDPRRGAQRGASLRARKCQKGGQQICQMDLHLTKIMKIVIFVVAMNSKYIILISLLCASASAAAQDVTEVWEQTKDKSCAAADTETHRSEKMMMYFLFIATTKITIFIIFVR